MSRRVPFVDFGPVALPVPGAAAYGDLAISPGANRREDAARLQGLLELSDVEEGDHSGEASSLEDIFQAQPLDLFTQAFPDASAKRFATALRCLKLASSVVAATADIASCVHLNLHEDLLPQASLSVEMHADGLRFELCLVNPQTTTELASGLDRIAHELGTQLQIPVIVRLIHGAQASLIREVRWQPDGTA